MNEPIAPERTKRSLPADPSRHFPMIYAQRLISAQGDFRALDRITDEMAAAGLVRPRSDASLFPSSLKSGN